MKKHKSVDKWNFKSKICKRCLVEFKRVTFECLVCHTAQKYLINRHMTLKEELLMQKVK